MGTAKILLGQPDRMLGGSLQGISFSFRARNNTLPSFLNAVQKLVYHKIPKITFQLIFAQCPFQVGLFSGRAYIWGGGEGGEIIS